MTARLDDISTVNPATTRRRYFPSSINKSEYSADDSIPIAKCDGSPNATRTFGQFGHSAMARARLTSAGRRA